MQLYTLGLSTLEGGVLWEPGSRIFRLALLEPGSTGFSAGNATVTAALAQGNNDEYGSSRVDLEYSTRELSPGVRQIRFKSTNQLRDRDLNQNAGAGIIYQVTTDDTDSIPIFFLNRSDLAALAGGEGFTYNTADTGIEQSEVRTTAAALRNYLNAGVKQVGTLAIDAVPEKFKTTTTLIWHRNGMQFSKAAETAIVFTAAHPVTASKFGIVLVQVDDAGVVTTKIPGATQTTTMAYNSAALALAALPAADAGNTAIGYIAIENNAGTWTANTDDLTNASDVTTAAFVDATVVALPGAVS